MSNKIGDGELAWQTATRGSFKKGRSELTQFVRAPDLGFIEQAPAAKISFSLLEKSPMSLSELALRTDMELRTIHEVLDRHKNDLGAHLIVFPLVGDRARVGEDLQSALAEQTPYSHVSLRSGCDREKLVGIIGEAVVRAAINAPLGEPEAGEC